MELCLVAVCECSVSVRALPSCLSSFSSFRLALLSQWNRPGGYTVSIPIVRGAPRVATQYACQCSCQCYGTPWVVTWLSHVVVSVVPSWVATRTHYLRYISHTLWLHDSWVAVQFTPTPTVMDLANRIVSINTALSRFIHERARRTPHDFGKAATIKSRVRD